MLYHHRRTRLLQYALWKAGHLQGVLRLSAHGNQPPRVALVSVRDHRHRIQRLVPNRHPHRILRHRLYLRTPATVTNEITVSILKISPFVYEDQAHTFIR